jgi:hypothetical protein
MGLTGISEGRASRELTAIAEIDDQNEGVLDRRQPDSEILSPSI